jgi:hypothetical protein
MAEFWRALKTLKALQAEPADVLEQAAGADLVRETPVVQLAAPAPMRARPSRAAARRAHGRSPRTERTRAPHGLRAARAAHGRPRLARAAACTPRRRSLNKTVAERRPAAPAHARPTSERRADMAAQRSTMPQ